MDAETGETLPSAHITIEGTSLGSITNEKGEFLLYIPAQNENKKIRFSYVGYLPASYEIKDVKGKNNIIVRLTPDAVSLEEVTVSPFKSLELIQNAIAKIPENYGDTHVAKGFYRLTTKNDIDFMHLSEVVMDQYYPGYGKKKEDNQVKLLKMRSIMDNKASHGLELGMKPKGIMAFDLLNNREGIDLLNKKGLKKHDFYLEGEINYHGHPAHVISFDQKEGQKESLYEGKMYIHQDSHAIMYIEYALSPSGLQYAKFGNGATRSVLKLMGIRIKPKGDKTKIHYKQFNDRWYLSHVESEGQLNISSEREHYNFPAFTRIDYIVTEIDTTQKEPFPNDETLGNSKIFENQNSEYSEAFWENYNIILADFSFMDIAGIIQKSNDEYNYKQQIEDRIHKFPKDKSVRIDSILNIYHKEGLFQGTALIKHQGEIIYQKSFGYANEEKEELNTNETSYRIGSSAKTFTSMLVMQLVNDGKLSLDDPIATYYPTHPHGKVTIEQLLTHQSGIPSYTKNVHYVSEIFKKSYSLDSMIYKYCSDPLEFESGSGFSYSNSGYILLAGILEKASGKKFDALLKEKILEPLGMDHTRTKLTNNAPVATGYLYGKPEPVYPLTNTLGAGSIITTANDLLKWDEALYTNALLPKDLMEAMFQPRAKYIDWDGEYGYGWMIDDYQFDVSKKHKIIYHPGTDLGFYAMFVRQPDEQNTLILLSNHGDFPRFDITDLILNELN